MKEKVLMPEWENPFGFSSFKQAVRALFKMTKPTIGLLVVVTTLPGILLAIEPESSISQVMPKILWILLGTWLASASAAVFNQIIDQKIDRSMRRTTNRPMAKGDIDTLIAFCFATYLGFWGAGILCWGASPLASAIAVGANAFYVLVYTAFLKKRTPQNIVIGGAAGSVGPLIGYSGFASTLNLESIAMFFLIFLWTPPHFWALAIKYVKDYAAAGIPMYPVIKGIGKTKNQILLYSVLMFIPQIFLFFSGTMSWPLMLFVAGLQFYFIRLCYLLWAQEDAAPMRVFLFSCIHLFLFFIAYSVDLAVQRL